MKPPFPDELEEDNEELPAEGMMFVGDEGKILSGFHVDSPRIIPKRRMEELVGPSPEPTPPPWEQFANSQGQGGLPAFMTQIGEELAQWMAACKGGEHPTGNFLEANTISELANLAFVALRSGKKVVYDTDKMEITNDADATKYLTRTYRKGWELA
jgi:hypothetical protein